MHKPCCHRRRVQVTVAGVALSPAAAVAAVSLAAVGAAAVAAAVSLAAVAAVAAVRVPNFRWVVRQTLRLPRTKYLDLIGQEQPVVVFANLLRNDPINLVVRKEVVEERGISADMPLAQRLEAMRGLKVGVAPGPPTRLRILFESVGMDADTDIEIVITHGPEQNQAFEEGQFDAIYAHTPFLETALVDQGAVIIVNQAAGEIPELRDTLHHALVTTRDYADANPEVVLALTRAVYRAQQLMHADGEATVQAIRASGVELQAPQGLELIVALYEPAIPDTPEVSADLVRTELALYPAHKPAPDFSGIDVSDRVATQFAEQAISGTP